MIYNFKTKKALKFLLWLSAGINAFAYCFFSSLHGSDTKLLIFGAAALILQAAHGVRVAFFNKTLVNMSLGFCRFQLWLLIFFSLVAALGLGGTYGFILFALALAELFTSVIISNRKKIVTSIRELLII